MMKDRNRMRKWVALAMGAALLLTGCGVKPEPELTQPAINGDYQFWSGARSTDERTLSAKEYGLLNSVGTDMYGRSFSAADSHRTDRDRYTGMIYFLNTGSGNDVNGIYNVTEIIEKYGIEEFGKDTENSPSNSAHLWGQSALGYYSAGDEWVMRRHIELFAAAGIDFLLLDCSNTIVYNDVAKKLFDILAEYRLAGWNVPRVAYMLSNGAPDAARINLEDVYNRFYKEEKYSGIWFRPEPEAKPLVVVAPDTAASLIASASPLKDYFYFRDTQWPVNDNGSYTFRENGFPWMEYNYPQPVHIDAMNVSVAQHTTVKFSDTQGSRGRGWTAATGNDHENFGKGANYQNQWNSVFENEEDLRFVIVTGWNEWYAQKMYRPDLNADYNGYMMCDTFNDEYSRDIEPCLESRLLDTPYLQTIANNRKYKQTEATHYRIPSGTPSMDEYGIWSTAAVYEDFTGEAGRRYWPRFDGKVDFDEEANRIDLKSISILKDSEYVYFRIETVGAIPERESGDGTWMNLFLKPANAKYTDKLGYSYVINREGTSTSSKILAANGKGGYANLGTADLSISGSVMIVRVPLESIGLTVENCTLEVKVADNFGGDSVMDFYSKGDSMPAGRLNYQFGY